MSMSLMVDAMKVRVGNPLRKLVLIKLADNANDQGECWPSYQHIADQCEISRRSVVNHIDELEGAGFLKRESRIDPKKGSRSNIYHLTISQGTPFAKKARTAKSPGANAALPPVQEIHQGGANAAPPLVQEIHQGSANAALGGSAGAAPRISHSFEPVIEPVIEPVTEPFAPQASPESRQGILIECGTAVATDSEEGKPRCAIPEDMPGPKDQSCKTFKSWANYAMAYRKRYEAWPVWNQKVAGQFGQLVKRLGADVAHHVSAFFVTIDDARLINGCHSVGDLLYRCEAYCTQWQTNRRMNATTARQAERKQSNLSAGQEAARRILEKAQGGQHANA